MSNNDGSTGVYQRGDVFGLLEFLPSELLDLIFNSLPRVSWHTSILYGGWYTLGFKHRSTLACTKHASDVLNRDYELTDTDIFFHYPTKFRSWLQTSLATPQQWYSVSDLSLLFQRSSYGHVYWENIAECLNEHQMRLPKLTIVCESSLLSFVDVWGKSQLAEFLKALRKRPYTIDFMLDLDELTDADLEAIIEVAQSATSSDADLGNQVLREQWTTIRRLQIKRGPAGGPKITWHSGADSSLSYTAESFLRRLMRSRQHGSSRGFLEEVMLDYQTEVMFEQAATALAELHSETLRELRLDNVDWNHEWFTSNLMEMIKNVHGGRWPMLRKLTIYGSQTSGRLVDDVALGVIQSCPMLEHLSFGEGMMSTETIYAVLINLPYLTFVHLTFFDGMLDRFKQKATMKTVLALIQEVGIVVKERRQQLKQLKRSPPWLQHVIMDLPTSFKKSATAQIKDALYHHWSTKKATVFIRLHSYCSIKSTVLTRIKTIFK